MPPPTMLLTRSVGEMRHYLGDHGGHVHGHAQLLFGLDGTLEVDVEGHLMRVDASAGLIVPAGRRHCSAASRRASVWVIDTPAGKAYERVSAFSLQGHPPPWLSITRSLAHARTAARVLPRRLLDATALAAVVTPRLHEDWPTARLAAQVSLSVAQFHARWRGLTGQTPQCWLRGLRLDEATRLLQVGWGAEAVAAQVGYASASALLFSLRRERGVGVRTLR